jgi:elongation factor G
MKEYTPDHIRNVSLIGHGGAGKTMTAEALLFSAGATTRLGRVEEGNTVSDYRADEIERRISVSSSLINCEWKGNKINILDTPGYTDFTGDVKSALRVTDTALLLLKAVEGVEVGTEIVWRYTQEYQNSVVILLNKLDQENADFDRVVAQARDQLNHDILPLQFPLKQGLGFESIVDVIRMKVLKYTPGTNGKFVEEEIPADAQARAQEFRQQVLELIAETDEALLNTYLEKGTLSPDEIKAGLKTGIR